MIALIAGPDRPPRFAQGLGLPYLAAVLEEAGYEAKIFDRYLSPGDTTDTAVLDEHLAETIALEQPLIVGMTIHTPDYAKRVRLAAYLRERLPQTLLVAGGHHPSAEPEQLLRDTVFDVCVIGEGEETLLEIAQRITRGEGSGSGHWLQDVPGVAYKHQGQVVRTPPRPPPADIDALPHPAHHLLGLEDYSPHPVLGIKSTALLTYRGCPKSCAFCLNPQGRRIRRRSPSNVVDEMARVVDEYEVRGFNVYDNLFGLDRKHAAAVCQEIQTRRLDVVWDCWTAGDVIGEELAKKMRASGCIYVGFGAESGDDEVLARAHRGFTSAQHQAGIHALSTAGLKPRVYFMIGLPGESEESVRQTVEFAKRCGADEVVLSVYRPYPGTAIWQKPEAFGTRITRGPNFEAYIETSHLSRTALLECTQWAVDELKKYGLKVDILRYDRYEWE